jgi:hypothetical protein
VPVRCRIGLLFRVLGRLNLEDLDIERAKPRDADAIGYVVTYLIPFLALSSDTWQARAALLLFVVVVGALYVRSHIFYVNPILNLVGYRLFELEVGTGFVILMSRKSYVAPRTTLQARRISDYVYIE